MKLSYSQNERKNKTEQGFNYSASTLNLDPSVPDSWPSLGLYIHTLSSLLMQLHIFLHFVSLSWRLPGGEWHWNKREWPFHSLVRIFRSRWPGKLPRKVAAMHRRRSSSEPCTGGTFSERRHCKGKGAMRPSLCSFGWFLSWLGRVCLWWQQCDSMHKLGCLP